MAAKKFTPNERFQNARLRLDLSREELADLANTHLPQNNADQAITANLIGKIERGVNTWPRAPRRTAFRLALRVQSDGDLGFINQRGRRALRLQMTITPAPSSDSPPRKDVPAVPERLPADRQVCPTKDHGRGSSPPHAVQNSALASQPISAHPTLIALPTPAAAGLAHSDVHQCSLQAPAGRFFPGASINAQVHPAVDDGRIMASLPSDYDSDPFLAQPGRGLVLGRTTTADGHHLFGLDRLHARRRLRAAAPGARLPIPNAYHLDELTLALLWAVTNLDAALLADDAILEEHRHNVTTYETLTTSAVSRDLAADLTATTHMWLGSAFCAGHIMRHSRALHEAPIFWTREQRGEEAASWLLFAHKHHYLDVTAQRFPGATRAFCIPSTAVHASPLGERILLLLAVALMESHGIHTAVTDEPEYAAVPGFVHDRTGTAIVANWVGADGIWHVDVTDRRPLLAEYRDAGDFATQHSVIAAPSSHDRLRELAYYLDINWSWLVRRCQQLAHYGTEGLAQPRSRHLSLAGVDRACQHLAAASALSH